MKNISIEILHWSLAKEGKSFFIMLAALVLLGVSGCSTLTKRLTKEDVKLNEQIGQMIMVGFRGCKESDSEKILQYIQENHLGGVILFDYDVPSRTPIRNVQSPQQVKELISTLQKAAATPLLVAIDQEGGRIGRLKEKYGFPQTLSAQYLGQTNDLAITYAQTSKMSKTLAELGINLNLAPVVDLNINPDNPIIAKHERSFSADSAIVTAQALEYIKAHHEQGVLCTLKHFPGHGSSKGDSHLGLVDVTDTWTQVELQPYEAIIKSGNVDVIMTAHVFNRKLDPAYPATLSKTILTGLLRKNMNYDGVIISDDMQMKAITNYYGFATAIQKTIDAGTDIILISNNTDTYEEDIALRAIKVIKQLVRNKKISLARINESYQRIKILKSKLQNGKNTL